MPGIPKIEQPFDPGVPKVALKGSFSMDPRTIVLSRPTVPAASLTTAHSGLGHVASVFAQEALVTIVEGVEATWWDLLPKLAPPLSATTSPRRNDLPALSSPRRPEGGFPGGPFLDPASWSVPGGRPDTACARDGAVPFTTGFLLERFMGDKDAPTALLPETVRFKQVHGTSI